MKNEDELTKKVMVTMTKNEQEKAQKSSKKIFGKSNVSGFVRYLIRAYIIIVLISLLSCDNSKHEDDILLRGALLFENLKLTELEALDSLKTIKKSFKKDTISNWKYVITYGVMTRGAVVTKKIKTFDSKTKRIIEKEVTYIDKDYVAVYDSEYVIFFGSKNEALFCLENYWKDGVYSFYHSDMVGFLLDSAYVAKQ